MPSISDQTSVAANGVSGNVLSGQLFEFVPPGQFAITLLAAAAAIGLRVTFTVGGQVIVNDQAVSRANRFPILPDDVVTSIGAVGGERLFLEFRNTTGAAIVVDWKISVD